MRCKCNISDLNVANITVSKRLKCGICNSTLSKLLQIQQFCFDSVANATLENFLCCKYHSLGMPSVLLLQHYHAHSCCKSNNTILNCCGCNSEMCFRCCKYNNADLKVLRLQQIKPFECGKCNNTDLQVLRLQQAKSLGCCICNNLCPEVLRLQQLHFPKVLHLQHLHHQKCCECHSTAFKLL